MVSTRDTRVCMAYRLSIPAGCCSLCQKVPGRHDCLVTLHTGGHSKVLQGSAGVNPHLLCYLPYRCVHNEIHKLVSALLPLHAWCNNSCMELERLMLQRYDGITLVISLECEIHFLDSQT